MAITTGRASNSTAQTVAQDTWTDIFPTSYQGCEEITVQCPTGGGTLKCSVCQRGTAGDTIHRIGVGAANVPDDWIEIAAGESYAFAGSIDNKITRVMVAGSGGTATFKWTVTKS